MKTKHGKCHDCAQGVLISVASLGNQGGFEQFILDGEPAFWFCRYCGSNHVDIMDSEGGLLISQGDLYP
jgi:hypothetical protein